VRLVGTHSSGLAVFLAYEKIFRNFKHLEAIHVVSTYLGRTSTLDNGFGVCVQLAGPAPVVCLGRIAGSK